MKKNLKLTIIAALSVIIVAAIICPNFMGKPVKTEAHAIEIAKEHVFKKYQDDFSGHKIAVYSESNIWIVSYEWGGGFGGGGPEVHIRKSNGKVIYCMLQS